MSVMLLRNSERQTFKTCRHRWQWTYRDGRQAREAGRALRFGDLVHQALAAYYKPGRKRGPHPTKTFTRLFHEQAKALGDDGFDVWSDEKWVAALPLGERMLTGYVERYAEEDREWEVIASEATFQLPLLVPEHLVELSPTATLVLPSFRFKVVGTFDGVWRHINSGRLAFKEFKTTAAIKNDGLAMDEQAGTYWTYGPRYLRRQGLLGGDELPSSILYTWLRKAAPDPDGNFNAEGQKLNKDGSVSKVQPAPYFARVPVYRDQADRQRMHERVLAEARDVWLARQGLLPLYKNPGPLYLQNCMTCPVKEACEVHEAGGDHEPVLNAITARWNPYAAHELPERF